MNIEDIIKKVDNNEIEIEGDYFFKDYYGVTLVGQKVQGYDLYVYWGEYEDIQKMKDKLWEYEITQEEFDEFIKENYNPEDDFDLIDFDVVVAYEPFDGEFTWIGRDFDRY